MSSWNKLPMEIIAKIADEIESPESIIQFKLTCKDYASLGQHGLYTNTKLLTKFNLEAFTKKITAHPSLGLLVERLHISNKAFEGFSDKAKRLDCFTVLIEYCVNVRQILTTSPFDRETRQLLIKALQEGKWGQLHLIEPPYGDGRSIYYEQAVWIIRNRSTKLQVCQLLPGIAAWPEHDRSHHLIPENILAFLTVQYFTLIKRQGYMPVIQLDEYVDNCVSLKKVTIKCLHSDPDPTEDLVLKECRMLSYISTVKQQPAIKQLHATIPLFRGNSLKYIMHKFPKIQELTLIKSQGNMSIIQFNECIDNYISLKKLTIRRLLPDLDPVKYFKSRRYRILNCLPTTKQQLTIKQLHVDLPLFHDISLIYIMHKFPLMSVLTLRCQHITNTGCSHEVSREFLEYISKIPFIDIDQLEIRNVCELLSTTFKNRIKSDSRKIFFFLSVITIIFSVSIHLVSSSNQQKTAMKLQSISPVHSIMMDLLCLM
jgi:hypothetical protein